MRLEHVQIIASTCFGLAVGWGLPRPWRTRLSEKQHVLSLQDDHEEQQWPSPASMIGDGEALHRPRIGFVALGDSYSAGIGTGVEGKEDACRRGLGAYPQLIASDLPTNSTSFQFLSCTGSTTEEILAGGAASQLDALNASRPVDFALLTVGGNDLGFFEVMNACIFRFYNFYSGTCETALARAQERLDGHEFDQRLYLVITELLDKVRWERKPGFRVTVTGYAQFFNDRTAACDDMSLGIWWRGPKLERALRRRMNAMVRAVNRKIAAAVARINRQFTRDRVLFVDYDAAFEGHRFCERGVVEPDYARNETWFFLVGGPDNVDRPGGNGTTTTTAESPSLSGVIDPATCLPPAQLSGDWGELARCYMAMSKAEDPTLRPARDGDEIMMQNSMWHVPTYYGKTFHPRSLGHEAIRDRIYEVWSSAVAPSDIKF
ncbi:Lipase 1 [Apiospora phragmitis]|uniref:Lipase 1 n=1 Tax=Apiospora phragmitis TaxID=2905665 RepID=A0ABR1UIK8_9PEZI